MKICPNCAGEGYLNDEICEVCDGYGSLPETKKPGKYGLKAKFHPKSGKRRCDRHGMPLPEDR